MMQTYFLRLSRPKPGLAGRDEMIVAADNPRDAYHQADLLVRGLSKEVGSPATLESGEITAMKEIEPEDIAVFNQIWYGRAPA